MSTKEKSYNKLQWFFLVIFIPIVFTVILSGVIVSLLGINVLDKAKEIGGSLPIVSSYLSDEPENLDGEQVPLLEQKIAEQQAELDKLHDEMKRKDEEILQLERKQLQLEESQVVQKELAARKKKELGEIAKTYETMSPKNAAAILAALPIDEAFMHLEQVSIEVRANILAKMESKKAADLMSRLANN
ncbi:MotE family protein [bacterium LRH843]|nr:MotE family protein [bacterium LRH843]